MNNLPEIETMYSMMSEAGRSYLLGMARQLLRILSVTKDTNDRLGERCGSIGYLQVQATLRRKSLGSNRRTDDGDTHGHGLDDLEAGSATAQQGNDKGSGPLHVRTDIRNAPGRHDTRVGL